MKSNLRRALIAAIPVQVIFFTFCAYPDGGYEAEVGPIPRALGHIWLVMHWPGLHLLRWLYSLGTSWVVEIAVVFISGYCAMVLVFLALFSAFSALRHRVHGPAAAAH